MSKATKMDKMLPLNRRGGSYATGLPQKIYPIFLEQSLPHLDYIKFLPFYIKKYNINKNKHRRYIILYPTFTLTYVHK
ncbi:hypothetical protein ANASTE_00119 [Anaerofustis stercorihominis DSM 17244]|uniref:Uncharacterized protein n=1 Tax=Anaerofustis stercorihominis DSM 17244 TaxID=445971 RepID=B1C5Y1_9FIRM|nr:hypothetical protein ANASTE_00119 [Anaerofustis stercorihominis DSM 17244]